MEREQIIEDLRTEIESCRMDIAGGNSMNVNDALQTLKELAQLLTPSPSQSAEEITEEDIKNAIDIAYKESGENAYFGNGFKAGMKFASTNAEQDSWISVEDRLPEKKEGQILVWKASWNRPFIFWASFVQNAL